MAWQGTEVSVMHARCSEASFSTDAVQLSSSALDFAFGIDIGAVPWLDRGPVSTVSHAAITTEKEGMMST